MALLLLPACEQKGEKSPAPATPEAKTETPKPEAQEKPKPAATTQPAGAPMKEETETAKPKAEAKPAAAGKNPRVVMSTTKGDITLELDQAKAPISVENFLQYVDDGYYNGTIFHRVIANFMIQGGGFGKDKKQKEARGGIKNEWQNGLKNVRGTISMARVGGNPNSGTCQFFINVVNNASLDRPQRDGAGYAVFGKVVAGMDVVDAIKSVPTKVDTLESLRSTPAGKVHQAGPAKNVPAETVVIESVKRAD